MRKCVYTGAAAAAETSPATLLFWLERGSRTDLHLNSSSAPGELWVRANHFFKPQFPRLESSRRGVSLAQQGEWLASGKG